MNLLQGRGGTKMKPSSLQIALVILCTGCSGANTPQVQPTSEPSPSASASSASPLPSASATPTGAPTAASAAPAASAEPSSPAAESLDPLAPELSPRGNLIKQIGEPAGIIDGNGERLANFVINSISPDVQCTEASAEPAENGLFVAVDVSVQTSPAMAAPDALISSFDMSSSLFRTISPEGISSNADPGTFAAFLCLDDTALLPSSIGPGENAQGIVLLDVEHPAGTLIFEDLYTGSAWEWTYPG